MMDKAITAFFDERKAAWMKKNTKASMSEQGIREKEIECETIFSLAQWLPSAAKRAGQISISTHPCTFSHPSARKNKNGYASSIIAKKEHINDGFLKSGNVSVASDALGNAAALDVYKFLTLKMEDGQTLLQHLEQETELALSLLNINDATAEHSYQALKEGFLAMTANHSESVTSSKIKQVFFPLISEGIQSEASGRTDYHQLSVLTASGIVFEMRKRLDAIRFGDEVKLAREKRKNNETHTGYSEIYDLTTIGYGGTKPQNISVLNNLNGGKAHLFMSVPPKLKRRDIQFPNSDFFSQTVNYYKCKYQFNQLHKLYSRDSNNMHIRAERDEYYQSIIDHVIEKMWQVRGIASEQYKPALSQLSLAQQTWLCETEEQKHLRETTDDWLIDILESVTNYLFHGYEKVLGRKAIKFSDAEHKHMQNQVSLNMEAFR